MQFAWCCIRLWHKISSILWEQWTRDNTTQNPGPQNPISHTVTQVTCWTSTLQSYYMPLPKESRTVWSRIKSRPIQQPVPKQLVDKDILFIIKTRSLLLLNNISPATSVVCRPPSIVFRHKIICDRQKIISQFPLIAIHPGFVVNNQTGVVPWTYPLHQLKTEST